MEKINTFKGARFTIDINIDISWGFIKENKIITRDSVLLDKI